MWLCDGQGENDFSWVVILCMVFTGHQKNLQHQKTSKSENLKPKIFL